MSVGKESILRAANAGAKKTAKSGAAKKSVVSTADAEQLEAAVVTEDKKESVNGPVHINEELPVYLL